MRRQGKGSLVVIRMRDLASRIHQSVRSFSRQRAVVQMRKGATATPSLSSRTIPRAIEQTLASPSYNSSSNRRQRVSTSIHLSFAGARWVHQSQSLRSCTAVPQSLSLVKQCGPLGGAFFFRLADTVNDEHKRWFIKRIISLPSSSTERYPASSL